MRLLGHVIIGLVTSALYCFNREHSFCNAHWAYKSCYLSLGKYQAYKTYYLYFKSTPSLQGLLEPLKTLRVTWPLGSHSNWIVWTSFAGVECTQGYFTPKKSKPRFFNFLPQFSTRFGRFFIRLISYLFSGLS